jgi:hypothetical protein
LRAVWRFILDAMYVAIFAAVTAIAATAFHFLAEFLQSQHVDPFVVGAFRQLGRAIAVLDDIGVVLGSIFALYRFVKELANDP